MVDIAAIAGVTSSLKAIGDIAKAMMGIRDGAMLQAKAVELNAIILSAQQHALEANNERFALLERVRELEKQNADLEAWNSEKQRYELKDVGRGSFAYVAKESRLQLEPPTAFARLAINMARNPFFSRAPAALLVCWSVPSANYRLVWDLFR